MLDGITAWMQVNGEAIYSTRPWKMFGEGPCMQKDGSSPRKEGMSLGSSDIRFTANKTKTIVYAFVMGWPEQQVVIEDNGDSQSAAACEGSECGTAGAQRTAGLSTGR